MENVEQNLKEKRVLTFVSFISVLKAIFFFILCDTILSWWDEKDALSLTMFWYSLFLLYHILAETLCIIFF